ncbi:hypothetical protein B0H14DRAFT_2958469, partial [Mycena olivaceomarginata]
MYFANSRFFYLSLCCGWLLHCACPLPRALCISSSLITVVLPAQTGTRRRSTKNPILSLLYTRHMGSQDTGRL